MNTEKIEKLKKALNDSRTPENLKKRMLSTIAMFEAEDLKESASKVVNVAPEEKEEPTPAPKVERAKVTRTPRVKKIVAQKESTAKKPTAMALAKDIRKDGESWKEAVKRASSEMKKGTTETKKAVVETKKATITEMQKLLKFVKRRKELKGISGTNLQRDASRSAKPSGKRTSKDGNVYYENRENRTDRLAPNYPKGSPKLANGGFMDGVYAGGGSIASKYVLVESRGYDGGVIFLLSREELNKIPYETMQEKAEAFVENVTDYNGETPYRNGRLITDTKIINDYAKGHSHYNYKVILSDDEDNYPDGFYVIKHKEPLKFNNGGFMDGVYAGGGEIADIQKMKKTLIAKAKSKGLYENFGQKEVRILQDKYGYTNNVKQFDNWAMNFDSTQYADGGFMDGVYAEEGAEVTYIRNKDGIRVKSVAMPEEKLTEAEWLAKHNESREARTYQLGGGIFADTFTGTTGTHYTGLVGETNAMSSGEMFMAGGRVRRTKSQMTKDRENKEIDAYNWYIVDLQTNKAITGNEYKEDAIDALSDYDGDKRYKVVSKRTLKSLGIENPNESWKSYEVGGAIANQQLIANAHLRPAEMFGREGIPAYASGGGVRTQNGREYSLGRNWTNDHRHENKEEDYEVPMYRRK